MLCTSLVYLRTCISVIDVAEIWEMVGHNYATKFDVIWSVCHSCHTMLWKTVLSWLVRSFETCPGGFASLDLCHHFRIHCWHAVSSNNYYATQAAHNTIKLRHSKITCYICWNYWSAKSCTCRTIYYAYECWLMFWQRVLLCVPSEIFVLSQHNYMYDNQLLMELASEFVIFSQHTAMITNCWWSTMSSVERTS